MLVWRISAARYAASAFSGEGGLKYAARWHHKGTAVVYTSATLALAALEMLANVEAGEIATDLVAISAAIPDILTIVTMEAGKLPRNWRDYPGPDSLRMLGSGWAAGGESAVLSVPSVLIPSERNYLLNPAHPDFRRIQIHRPAAFSFDPRLWKSRRGETAKAP